MRLRHSFCFLLVFLAAHGAVAQSAAPVSLSAGFRHPPVSAGPWVFWMWLRVQTSPQAITADLEAMHAEGIRGAILYDSGVGGAMEATSRMELHGKNYIKVPTQDFAGAHFTDLPYSPMPSWQPRSRELVRWAAREAARLHIKLVITVGLASTSAEIALEDGQQFLEWSELPVKGPAPIDQMLPAPDRIVDPGHTEVRSMVPQSVRPGSHAEYRKSIAVLALPDREGVGPADVIDLTSASDPSGHLVWNAPAGKWRVLRFAYEPTGMSNAWGLYTDSMSVAALQHTWNATMGKLLGEMTPAQRRGIYGVEDDSWEAGISTWTPGYENEFKTRRGYDLVPWLPALANLSIGSPAERDGVKRDFYRTTADLIAQHHYAALGDIARRNHLLFYSEAAGPNSGQLDSQQNFAGVDVPMGEFWVPSEHRPTPDRRFLARDAASAGHLYGKHVLACESLTSVGPQWEDTFFGIKNTADQGFTDGCNLIVIHNFSQSPSLTAKPGYVYFAGTHYSRNVTWWKQTPAFNTYLARVGYLLQQGVFVADALYFRGDGIGQIEQRKSVPALPAPGYDHDNVSLQALLHQVAVQNGKLVLLDGTSYSMLVLPPGVVLPEESIGKIKDFVDHGAMVVGPRPAGVAGLQDASQRARLEQMVARLWDQTAPHHVFEESAANALARLKLAPDLDFTGLSERGDLDWLHRRSGDIDIYFLASRWDAPEKVSATFRVQGRQPELWNPVTGEIRVAAAFTQNDGTTTVPLQFDPRGSLFVIFRRTIATTTSGTASSNYPEIAPLQTLEKPWQVAFDPKWGGPAITTFDHLMDWTERPEPGIRFYSGTAIYSTTFSIDRLPKNGQSLLLDLGTVHEVASVKLNGKPLGVVWTQPATIELGPAARTGTNRLEITVVNLWPNRLIGDESLPKEQRLTETNAHKFNPSTPLYPSGLIGPVKLELATSPSLK